MRAHHQAEVAGGGGKINIAFITVEAGLQVALCSPERERCWLTGGSCCQNGQWEEGPGTWMTARYVSVVMVTRCRFSTIDRTFHDHGWGCGPLEVEQHMEMEISQFLANVFRGRANYYVALL